MRNWLENTLHQGRQVPVMVINKLRTDAERWQAAIREFTPPINLADILRGPTSRHRPSGPRTLV